MNAPQPRPCVHCEQPFTPARADARFCSPRCRVAHHRSVTVTDKPKPVTAGGFASREAFERAVAARVQKEIDRIHAAMNPEFERQLAERVAELELHGRLGQASA